MDIDYKVALIAFLFALAGEWADPNGFDRICNDPHIKCEER